MRGVLRALDAVPGWLRWALFLPLGIGCGLLIQGAVEIAFGVAGPPHRTIPGLVERVVTTFVGGVALTLLPAVLSPRPWPVGVALFAIGLVLRVSPAAYLIITTPYLRSRAPAVALAIAANTLGGGLALYLIRYAQSEKGDTGNHPVA